MRIKPLISIIVPCYNQAQYLDECLESVLNQTYLDWECIIVNDGSPDNTKEIAQNWCNKDTRFKYIEKINGGASSARNAGIKNSQGIYILPLDADDKISINYIDEAMKVFSGQPDTDLVYCEAWLFGDKIAHWDLPQYDYFKLLFDNSIFCSAIYRKEKWIEVNGYDEKMKSGIEDWDFWLRILTKDSKVIKLSITGFFYRIKKNSTTVRLNANSNQHKIFNYVFEKQMHIIEDYYEHSFPYMIYNFPMIEKQLYELKNNYKVLSKQVKISNLLKAICFKFIGRAKNIKALFNFLL